MPRFVVAAVERQRYVFSAAVFAAVQCRGATVTATVTVLLEISKRSTSLSVAYKYPTLFLGHWAEFSSRSDLGDFSQEEKNSQELTFTLSNPFPLAYIIIQASSRFI